MEQPKKEIVKNKLVQTYAMDMALVLSDTKEGLIKQVIDVEEKREIDNKDFFSVYKRNKLFAFLSLLLILISGLMIFFFLSSKKPLLFTVEKQITPIVFDKSSFLEVKDLKKDEIVQTILHEISASNVKIGGIEIIALSINQRIILLKDFASLLKINLDINNNKFIDDNFLMGFVNNQNNQSNINDVNGKDFFILLKVSSNTDVFSYLRTWESKIFSDLHSLFGIEISGLNNYLITKDFEDGVVENRNARILYDKDRKIVMMYIFANENYVVVTNTLSSAREVMLRLASSKVAQ